jgi:hypothetical protein
MCINQFPVNETDCIFSLVNIFYFRTRKCDNPQPQGIGYPCIGPMEESEPCLKMEPCGKIAALIMCCYKEKQMFLTQWLVLFLIPDEQVTALPEVAITKVIFIHIIHFIYALLICFTCIT